MKCTNCGKEISDGSRFCGYCGHKQNKRKLSKKTKRPKNGRKFSGIVFAALLLACAFIAIGVLFLLLRSGFFKLGVNDDENIDEIYFAPISDEHIAITEDGTVAYADDELLVVAKSGVSKEEIEKLAAKYGAEIVGCIEQTGDYQWKFDESKSVSEFEDILESLMEEDIIEDAYVNFVSDYWKDALDNVNYGSNWSDDLSKSSDGKGKSWGVEVINAPATWEYFNQHKSEIEPVKIGIVDGGFDESHEDLGFAKNGVFYNKEGQNGLPDEEAGKISRAHGTHVAGTMAAIGTNAAGISGVYPYGEGRLYGVSYGGMGYYDENRDFHTSAMEQKIAFAELILRNVKVINQSMGFNWQQFFDKNAQGQYENTSETAKRIRARYKNLDELYAGFQENDSFIEARRAEATMFAEFLNRALSLGYDFVIVSSAGNTIGKESEYNSYNNLITVTSEYKKVYDRIIVVGSIGKVKKADENHDPIDLDKYVKSDFSDAGNRVDIFAPGVCIYSTVSSDKKYDNKIYSDNGEFSKYWSGTSMASPHVAGVCANVWSANNGLSGDEVKSIVIYSLLCDEKGRVLTPYTSPNGLTKGIVDCQKAVMEAVRKKAISGKTDSEDMNLGSIEGWVYEADSDGNIDKSLPISYATIKVYDHDGKEIKTYFAGGKKADLVKTDSKGHYELFVMPGTYSVSASKEGYSDTESSTEKNIIVNSNEVHYAGPLALKNESEPMIVVLDDTDESRESDDPDDSHNNSMSNEASNDSAGALNPSTLEACPIIEYDEYQGNLADSFIYPIGQHEFSRGNQDITGKTYDHGLEAWIARWNYEDESSWAYSVFSLPEKYDTFTGKVVLIDSYNTTNFDSTLYFYDEDKNLCLGQYSLTPESIPLKFTVSVSGVTKLKILVSDNKAVSGGTSFGLVDCQESTNEATNDLSKPSGDEESYELSGDGYVYDASALPNSMPAYPSTGQKYWIIFNEGFRNERLEMSTFDVTGDDSDVKIVWSDNLIGYSSTGTVSRCNQYVYTQNEWVEIGDYDILSDLSHKVFAANVDVYDANGKIIISANDYNSFQ